jgi:hypothetical protein
MTLDIKKFEILMESVYRNSFGANKDHHMFDDAYHTSRQIGLIKPIGWLIGFINYLSPYMNGNPYPQFSLAYDHYEQGRMCAHDSYHHYYQINHSAYKVSFN